MKLFGFKKPSGMTEISLYYMLFYSASSIYIYLPKYLQQGARLTVGQNGAAQAVGPLVAIFMPFVWGRIADKSISRNAVWAAVLTGAALAVFFVPLSHEFVYIACILAFVSIFQTSVMPLSDSVCTEICTQKKWDFGQLRSPAPLGYAACTFIAGAVLRMDKPDIFVLYGLLALTALIPAFRLPKVPGYQSRRPTVPFYKLFTNKPLVILFIFTFCVYLTSGYYYSFFLLYFTSPEVGGSTAAFGVCNALASLAEFPTMLYIDRLIRRTGVPKIFLCALAVLALRWTLLGAIPRPAALIAINMLHGCSFACISYCVIIYINKYVQLEFKATGQAVNGVICMGVTKVISSAGGGYLTGRFGYRAVFVAMGMFVVCVAAAYAFCIPRIERCGDERKLL